MSPTPTRKGSKGSGSGQDRSHPPTPIYEHSNRYAPEVGNLGIDRRPSQPWLDADGKVLWSRSRVTICRIIDHKFFEFTMSAVITFNIAMIVLETDREALCFPDFADKMEDCPHANSRSRPWLKVANTVLLGIYTLEVLLRTYVERKRYLYNGWNALDAFIVATGWISLVAGSFVSIAFLRFFRLARLARMLRLFIAFRELYMLLVGLISALRTILWGAGMIFGTLLLWSILLVEFVHPVNAALDHGDCERCGRGYSTVLASSLTLFQTIVAGDSWGQISITVIEEAPWTAGLFVASLMTVSLGLMNLILAVIVERAAEARERDSAEKLKQKERDQEDQMSMLLKLCKQMDKDGGGTLCITELLEAYEEHEEFKTTLRLMDIQKDELAAVFKVLDTDGSGDISYTEFCEQLHSIRTRDTRTMLTFMRLSISEMAEQMEKMGSGAAFAAIQKEVQESSLLLQHHSKLLQSIDERLGKLSDGGGHLLDMGSTQSGKAYGLRPPTAPPRPVGAVDRHSTTETLLADLKQLGDRTQELAGLKGVIVRRVEEQVSTLTRQAGALAAIGVSLKSGGQLPDADLPGMGSSNMDRISEKLGRLQENMHYELAALLREVDQKLEDGAATLARNNELLASLSHDLKCPMPPQDAKQRGPRQPEKKANQDMTPSFSKGWERNPAEPAPMGFMVCSTIERGTTAPTRTMM